VLEIESMTKFPAGWEDKFTVRHFTAFMSKHKIPCSPTGSHGKRKKERATQIAKVWSKKRKGLSQGEPAAKRPRLETKGEADLGTLTV